MKRVLSILLIITGLSAFTTIPSEIYWSKDFKMTRNHFVPVNRGQIEPGRAATITTEIRLNMNYNKTYTAKAFAVFHTQKSYMLTTLDSAQCKIVINHEMGHFNVTEYIVRCLNSSLTGVKDPNTMVALYNDYVTKRDQMQEQYDRETNNGLDLDEQKRWDEKLYKLLNNN